VRAAQGISLPQASALQRHQRRTDYGGEHSAGSLEAVSFAISPASAHVCAATSRRSLLPSTPQAAPSSALRYACLHGLTVATAHVCHCCRTRPLLLTVPLSPWPFCCVYHLVVPVLQACPTRHRCTIFSPKRVYYASPHQCPRSGEGEQKDVFCFHCVSRACFSFSTRLLQAYTLFTYYFSWSLASLPGVHLHPSQEKAPARSPEERKKRGRSKYTQNRQPARRCWTREHS
jgi:hypothetical protein